MHFGSAMRILCDFCQQVHAVEEGAMREESLMKSKVDIKPARGRQSSYVAAADAGSASTDLWIIISGLKASAWILQINLSSDKKLGECRCSWTDSSKNFIFPRR